MIGLAGFVAKTRLDAFPQENTNYMLLYLTITIFIIWLA
jgi:hypothetical protein